MRLRFSPEAEADLLAALTYIAADSPRNAATLRERILSAAERLVEWPEFGRHGRVAGTREIPVGRTPYLLVYQVTDAEIRIVRLLHGRQNWPPT